MRRSALVVIMLVTAVVLAGCAVGQPKEDDPVLNEPNPATDPSEVSTEVETGRYFVEEAGKHFRNNELHEAEEVLNRGFNVAPSNSALWHLLAKVRYLQEKYEECETVARRSLAYASRNSPLVVKNWRLIAHARKASGDPEGAQRALERIREPTGEEHWFLGWFGGMFTRETQR